MPLSDTPRAVMLLGERWLAVTGDSGTFKLVNVTTQYGGKEWQRKWDLRGGRKEHEGSRWMGLGGLLLGWMGEIWMFITLSQLRILFKHRFSRKFNRYRNIRFSAR
jgi:hypothetical protein